MRIRSHPMRRSVHITISETGLRSSARGDCACTNSNALSIVSGSQGLQAFKAYRLPTMPIKLLQYADMCSQASAEASSGAIYPAHAFRENYRKCADKIAIPK